MTIMTRKTFGGDGKRGGRRIKDAQRAFQPSVEIVDGTRSLVYRLTCSSCGSKVAPYRPADKRAVAPDIVEKKMTALGWTVGADEYGDKCSACTNRDRVAAYQKSFEGRLQRIRELEEIERSQKCEASMSSASKYRPMTIADRRIIIQKLTEVYQDESKGYKQPWTDAKVADDLGCSKDWVSKIREENFGAVPDFPDLREAVDAAARNKDEVEDLAGKVTELNRQLSALREKVGTDAKRIEEIRKSLN